MTPEDLDALRAVVLEADAEVGRLIRRAAREGPLVVEANAGTGQLARARALARARREYRGAVTRIVRGLQAADLSVHAATTAFEAAYRAAAEAAYRAGAAVAGDRALDAAALGRVAREVDHEVDRFAAFAGAIRRDEVDFPGGAPARAELYVAHLDAAANRGFVDAKSGEGVLWWWKLGDAEHCDDCLTLALASPYRERPPTVPRDGATVCLSNCRCTLVAQSTGAAAAAEEALAASLRIEETAR